MSTAKFTIIMTAMVMGFFLLIFVSCIKLNARRQRIRTSGGWQEIPGGQGMERHRINNIGWLVHGGGGRITFVPDSSGTWKIQEEENNED